MTAHCNDHSVASAQELLPTPFQFSNCRVEGDAEDKDVLTIRVPWHDLRPAVVYDLTLAIMTSDKKDFRLASYEQIDQRELSALGFHWDVFYLLVLPESRELLPDNFRDLDYGVSASVNNRRARILVLLKGK